MAIRSSAHSLRTQQPKHHFTATEKNCRLPNPVSMRSPRSGHKRSCKNEPSASFHTPSPEAPSFGWLGDGGALERLLTKSLPKIGINYFVILEH
jgi:hypothetical protein